VFSTKNWEPLIQPEIENTIFDYIKKIGIEIGINLTNINGMPNHLHLLFLQNPRLAISDTIKNIKGNSSHWINQQDLLQQKFAWQVGYGAFSVSESQREKVAQYIENQKIHHRKITFEEEYQRFLNAYGIADKNG
jgi:REP element-mobilizing transposase RayT